MTDDVRIVSVVSGAGDYWLVRGTHILDGRTFSAHTRKREVAALCLGAKFMEYPVRITREIESGDIVKASVL